MIKRHAIPSHLREGSGAKVPNHYEESLLWSLSKEKHVMTKHAKQIAIFLPSLVGGGAERVMVNLAEGFLERGYQVDMVLAKAEGPYLKSLPKDINVIDLNAKSVLMSLGKLVKYLKNTKPDTLYTALGHTNLTALLARIFARVSTKVVISVHNVTPPALTIFSKEGLVRKLLPFVYPRADAIVAVANAVAQDVVKKTRVSPKDVTVIYNPVVTLDIFEKAKAPTPITWFQADQPPVILGVGRLSKQKDFPTLIKAFAELRKLRPARLIILGEGEDRAELENLVTQLGLNEDVLMPGFVDNPYAYLAKADIFALSSIYEGLPTVMIEALALGTPVVSTDCVSGPSEILEDGKFGTIVPMKDPEKMATAFAEVLLKSRKGAIEASYHPYLRDVATENYLRVGGFLKTQNASRPNFLVSDNALQNN